MQHYCTLRFRFDSKIGITTETGCILWSGNVDKDGYGSIWPGPRKHGKLRAHRLAYEFAYGQFDKSLCVLHKCDVRLCVNPAHLFLGTRAENLEDMTAKNRRVNGESHGNNKLTKEQVKEIRRLCELKEKTQKEIAIQFGIHPMHVHQIHKRQRWKHV